MIAMGQPTEPGLYWARWRGISPSVFHGSEKFEPTKVTKDGDHLFVKDGGGHGGPTCWPLKHFEWGSKVEPPRSTKMTRLWTQDGLLHVQDEDLCAAVSLDEVYAELGEDFAKRIAAKIRAKTGQFKLMREAVAQWLEEGGWKDGK